MTNEQEYSASSENVKAATAALKCWACATDIKEGQRICTNCSNWQGGFRRRLNLTNTVITLLVALVAVIGSTAERISQALRGDPDPSLYVFGTLTDNWEQIDLTVENLNELDRVLPFVLDCEPFGAVAALGTDLIRFYNGSSTLIRGEESKNISYNIDPKALLPEEFAVNFESLSGINCQGLLGGADADFRLNVVFNNVQSIRFDLDNN